MVKPITILIIYNKDHSFKEENVKICFGEILKVNVFSRPLLE